MQQQIFYMVLDEQNLEGFFNNLRALMMFWKRDVSIHITDEETLKVLEKLSKKSKTFCNEKNNIKKLTLELDKQKFLDIIYNDTNDVESIGFGPISGDKKRHSYTPYKKKPVSRRLFISLKK